jgi:hypothetical protein
MRYLLLGALATLAGSGCIVVHDHPRHSPPPPPPPATTTVTVSYGWHHHRHVLWTEYYYCSSDDVYWLENCGYDDDDILVCLYIARHARVHPRYVFYEYDRCGRSLFAVSMYYRLPFGIWFVNEIPHGYACPGPYGRAYGYYWRGEHHYYSNSELHALVHLQIGVRYYGYNHVTYFDHYHRGYQRNDPHPFRTVVVQDHRKAGYGGKTCDNQAIVKRDRPWDHKDVKEWEKKREVERQQIKVSHTPEKERAEQEKVRREAESADRRQAAEEAKRRSEEMKKARVEVDKKNPDPARGPAVSDDRPKGPDTAKPGGGPGRPATPGADDKPRGAPAESRKGPEVPPARGPEPKGPESKGPPPSRGPEPKAPPPPPSRGPEPKGPEPKGPPPKGPEPERKPPPEPPKKEAPKGSDSKGSEGKGAEKKK